MAISHLSLLNEIRERLDDLGGDVGIPPSGYTYRWQYDDSGCLWKNVELVNYLNETIHEIGLRKPVFDTDDPTICQISIASGTRAYDLDPHILSVDEVRLESTGLPLIKSTVKRIRELISRYHPAEHWRTTTGAVTHYLEDEFTRQISLYRTPVAADALKMVVRRLYKDFVVWSSIAAEHAFGPELLSDAGWTANAGWAEVVAGTYLHTPGTTNTLTHSATIVSAKKYRVEFTIAGRTDGSLTISVGGQTITGITASGSAELTATSTAAFTVTPTSTFDGSISSNLTESISASAVVFTDMPDHFRKALIHGTTSLAYRKRDADTMNMDFVIEAQKAFEDEVGPKISFAEREEIRVSSNLWRSKSVNEFMARRAQTNEAEVAKARPNE